MVFGLCVWECKFIKREFVFIQEQFVWKGLNLKVLNKIVETYSDF